MFLQSCLHMVLPLVEPYLRVMPGGVVQRVGSGKVSVHAVTCVWGGIGPLCSASITSDLADTICLICQVPGRLQSCCVFASVGSDRVKQILPVLTCRCCIWPG